MESLKILNLGIGGDSHKDRKLSMTLLNQTSSAASDISESKVTVMTHKPRMSTLQTLEAKMANIEESLCLSAAPRRRKGTSLGSISSRSSPKLDTIISSNCSTLSKEQNNNTISSNNNNNNGNNNNNEHIVQNLRVQMEKGVEETDSIKQSQQQHHQQQQQQTQHPAGNVEQQKLHRLKNDAENKKIAIRNLKGALQKLDNSTSDIDSRIRQAELEYALGREELQLLSIVEEVRTVQLKLEKERSHPNIASLFNLLKKGHQLSFHAITAATGRWNANQRHDNGDGFYVDWVMEGEELQRGDRIIEVNGRVLSGRNKDELQKVCANTSKCDLVVIRKKSISMVNVIPHSSHQQLQQTQADNLRLQHRISYLEEQVKELLDTQKEKLSPTMSNGSQRSGTHVTSISISSSPSEHDHDDERPVIYQRGSFVTTIVGGKALEPPPKVISPTVQKSSSTTNIHNGHHSHNGNHAHHNDLMKSPATPKSMKALSASMSRISVSTDANLQKYRKDRERKERERYYNGKNISHHYNNNNNHYNNNGSAYKHQNGGITKSAIAASMNQIESAYGKSRRDSSRCQDERSIKSLDFESDALTNYDDYASEPVPTPKIRPTPPKKPLRLSLQRAQSLQAVSDNMVIPMDNIDKKRGIKRIHKGEQQTPSISSSTSGRKLTNGYSRSIDLSPKYIETNFTALNCKQRYV